MAEVCDCGRVLSILREGAFAALAQESFNLVEEMRRMVPKGGYELIQCRDR